MKLTSAEANKLLRKLREEHEALISREEDGRSFVAATVEKLEDARPDYDYAATQARLAELEKQIRSLKHAVNRFNLDTEVPGTGMTIDQLLIYIPQLTERKRKLALMRAMPEKQRNAVGRSSSLIEYTYANFDPAKVEEDYLAVTDELSKVQTALDLVNSTMSFEAEPEL